MSHAHLDKIEQPVLQLNWVGISVERGPVEQPVLYVGGRDAEGVVILKCLGKAT